MTNQSASIIQKITEAFRELQRIHEECGDDSVVDNISMFVMFSEKIDEKESEITGAVFGRGGHLSASIYQILKDKHPIILKEILKIHKMQENE